MLNLLLNLLTLLGIILTIYVIVIAFVGGLTFTVALIGKVVDVFKSNDDERNNGGG